MKIMLMAVATVVIICGLGALVLSATTGSGGLKRMVVRSGVYAVCRPDGYSAVCFLDADSKDGGLACLPCEVVGGCKC